MLYTDIHTHMLFATDDGPSRAEDAYQMVDMAYADGTRRICLTPHTASRMFGRSTESALSAYEALQKYAGDRYPDLSLSMANELHYSADWKERVKSGECHLIGGRYLLFDLPSDVTFFTLRYAVEEILATGQPAILAHAERYGALVGEYDALRDFCRRGLLIQLNASAFAPDVSFKKRRHVKQIVRRCSIAAVASDAHGVAFRPPILSAAEEVISARYGADAAALWLDRSPRLLWEGKLPY